MKTPLRLSKLLIAALLAVSACMPAFAVYASPEKESVWNTDRLRPIPAAADSLISEYAIDGFFIEYLPLEPGEKSAVMAEVFILDRKDWKNNATELQPEGYEPYRLNNNTAFIIRYHENPFGAGTEDGSWYDEFDANLSMYINYLKLAEIEVSDREYYGDGYSVKFPKINAFAVTFPTLEGERQLQKLIFIYKSSMVNKMFDFYVYDSRTWAKIKGGESAHAAFLGRTAAVRNIDLGSQFGGDRLAAFNSEIVRIKAAIKDLFVTEIGDYDYTLKSRDDKLLTIVDGKKLMEAVYIDSASRPLFQLREVSSLLGYSIEWQPEINTFIITTLRNELIANKRVTESYTETSYAGAGRLSCVLIDERTYVDTQFLFDVFHLKAAYKDGVLIFEKRQP